MQEKKPNAQSRATARYNEKKGLTVKSFKISQSLVNDFVEACEKNNEGQAKVLTRLMEHYINNSK
jgi:hypothetical protein